MNKRSHNSSFLINFSCGFFKYIWWRHRELLLDRSVARCSELPRSGVGRMSSVMAAVGSCRQFAFTTRSVVNRCISGKLHRQPTIPLESWKRNQILSAHSLSIIHYKFNFRFARFLVVTSGSYYSVRELIKSPIKKILKSPLPESLYFFMSELSKSWLPQRSNLPIWSPLRDYNSAIWRKKNLIYTHLYVLGTHSLQIKKIVMYRICF